MKRSKLVRLLTILLGNIESEKKAEIRVSDLIGLYGDTSASYFILKYLVRNEIAVQDQNSKVYYVDIEKLRQHLNELS